MSELSKESELWLAIKRLDRAKRLKASKQMIKMLEDRIEEEAAKVRDRFGGKSVKEIVAKIRKLVEHK